MLLFLWLLFHNLTQWLMRNHCLQQSQFLCKKSHILHHIYQEKYFLFQFYFTMFHATALNNLTKVLLQRKQTTFSMGFHSGIPSSFVPWAEISKSQELLWSNYHPKQLYQFLVPQLFPYAEMFPFWRMWRMHTWPVAEANGQPISMQSELVGDLVYA